MSAFAFVVYGPADEKTYSLDRIKNNTAYEIENIVFDDSKDCVPVVFVDVVNNLDPSRQVTRTAKVYAPLAGYSNVVIDTVYGKVKSNWATVTTFASNNFLDISGKVGFPGLVQGLTNYANTFAPPKSVPDLFVLADTDPTVKAYITRILKNNIRFVYDAEFEIRGNSSAWLPKKQFEMKLTYPKHPDKLTEVVSNIDGASKVVSFMGYAEKLEQFILFGDNYDRPALHNAVAFSSVGPDGPLNNSFSVGTPKTVEFILNGHYYGVMNLYPAKKRKIFANLHSTATKWNREINGVKVTDFFAGLKDGKAPGFYIEMENDSNGVGHAVDSHTNFLYTDPVNGANFVTEIKEFKTENLSDVGDCDTYVAEVRKVLDDLYKYLRTSFKRNTPLTDLATYIDIPSFIDMMIIHELAKNVDAYSRSIGLLGIKNKTTGTYILFNGPVWDLNLAYNYDLYKLNDINYFGNFAIKALYPYQCESVTSEHCGWRYEVTNTIDYISTKAIGSFIRRTLGGRGQEDLTLYALLMENKYFKSEFAKRWKTVKVDLLKSINDYIDNNNKSEHIVARCRNYKRWPYDSELKLLEELSGNEYDPKFMTVATKQVERLKTYIAKRAKFMDSCLKWII